MPSESNTPAFACMLCQALSHKPGVCTVCCAGTLVPVQEMLLNESAVDPDERRVVVVGRWEAVSEWVAALVVMGRPWLAVDHSPLAAAATWSGATGVLLHREALARDPDLPARLRLWLPGVRPMVIGGAQFADAGPSADVDLIATPSQAVRLLRRECGWVRG